jgi:photosystem II stability/assembly factor-like uncharacterized protein
MNAKTILTAALAGLVLTGGACSSTIQDGGVFKSWDTGENWEQKVYVGQDSKDRPVLIDGAQINKMFIEPGNENIIYALASGSIYKTYDHGEKWKRLELNAEGVNHIAIDEQYTNNIYLARAGDIIKSTDGGESDFEIIYRDSQGSLISRVAVDWYNQQRLYGITTTGLVLKSEDEGVNWRTVHKTEDPLTELKMSADDSRIIYIMELEKAIWKTTDGGITWDNLFETTEEKIDREEEEEEKDELVFEEIDGQEEEEDDDQKKVGRNAQPRLDFEETFPDADEVLQLAIDPNDGDTVFITSATGILRSTNGGRTWNRMSTVISEEAETQNAAIRNITVKPDDSKTILFTVGRLLHKTEDNGKTWQVIENFPSVRDFSALLFHPEQPDIIYAGTKTPVDDDNNSLFIGY